MSDESHQDKKIQANPGYAVHQLARSLQVSEEHPDGVTRGKARRRIAQWVRVLQGFNRGTLNVGSRTPVSQAPAWATLEVAAGGFATGGLLAGGEPLDHERQLFSEAGLGNPENLRLELNTDFLSEGGMARLHDWLQSGEYAIQVPEEGALLVVAWLLKQRQVDQADQILNAVTPFFGTLRFYPIPSARSIEADSRVHLATVGQVRDQLRATSTPVQIRAQREAVLVWRPLQDKLVSLFIETVEGELPTLTSFSQSQLSVTGGWPCQDYPIGWTERMRAWLVEFDRLCGKHQLAGKPHRAKEHFAQLIAIARRCLTNPRSLTGKDVGRVRLILAHYLKKYGRPDSTECQSHRSIHVAQVVRPLHSDLAKVLVKRMEAFPVDQGLDAPGVLGYGMTSDESKVFEFPVGTAIPESLMRRVQRCLCETVEVLVGQKLITSGEVMARLLPQITAQKRAGGFSDPDLQRLYSRIYQAFRRRRSLLLLNLESQVRLEELPWIAAIEPLRVKTATTKAATRAALDEVATLAITAFPHAILPNKLLQELRALVNDAELDLPLVDELAADIFMGQFTPKFAAAAQLAADLLENSLYTRYFGIDWNQVRALPKDGKQAGKGIFAWFSQQPLKTDPLAELCAARAKVPLGTWKPATNGMILEQQQIITTQNLAGIFVRLELSSKLQSKLPEMADHCLQWVVHRLNVKTADWHSRLIAVKNCAYAWRQMIFYLSLISTTEQALFLSKADDLMRSQPEAFRTKFQPAWRGLTLAMSGMLLTDSTAVDLGARCFLGWSQERHWLLSDVG